MHTAKDFGINFFEKCQLVLKISDKSTEILQKNKEKILCCIYKIIVM